VPKDRAQRGSFAWFRDIRIGMKLAAAITAAIVSLGVLSLIGVNSLQAIGKDNDALLRADKAGRTALVADMMHDAVRADVLQSLSADGADYEAALRGLDDHSKALKGNLDEVTAADLSSKVNGTVTAVTPAVDDYLLAAQQISRQARQDTTAARAAYPKFQTAFEQLETQLPSVVASLAEHATAAAAGTTNRRASATRLLVITALPGQ